MGIVKAAQQAVKAVPAAQKYRYGEISPAYLIQEGRCVSIEKQNGNEEWYREQLLGTYWAFNSCGVGIFQSFGILQIDNTFEDKAAFLSMVVKKYYTCGNVLYVLTNHQLNDSVHLLLQEIGSKELTRFNNLYHGPRKLHVFHVNVRNAIGRYVDNNGDPLKEPPKDDSGVWIEPKTVSRDFQHLPYKPPAKPKEAKNVAKSAEPAVVDPNLPQAIPEPRKETE
jgi:hypothetical protein